MIAISGSIPNGLLDSFVCEALSAPFYIYRNTTKRLQAYISVFHHGEAPYVQDRAVALIAYGPNSC